MGTYILEDKTDYLCLNESPNGYYLDTENNIYKRCFDKCEKCNASGNEINNNCIECKSDYSLYKKKMIYLIVMKNVIYIIILMKQIIFIVQKNVPKTINY